MKKQPPISDMILHDEIFFTRLYKRDMELKMISENVEQGKIARRKILHLNRDQSINESYEADEVEG